MRWLGPENPHLLPLLAIPPTGVSAELPKPARLELGDSSIVATAKARRCMRRERQERTHKHLSYQTAKCPTLCAASNADMTRARSPCPLLRGPSPAEHDEPGSPAHKTNQPVFAVEHVPNLQRWGLMPSGGVPTSNAVPLEASPPDNKPKPRALLGQGGHGVVWWERCACAR